MGMCHVAPAETASPGKRLYLIRLACGDGVRTAEPMAAFAKRVKAATGKTYDQSTISLLERDMQKWRLEDARAFAAVDPLHRGPAWLSGFDELPTNELLDPAQDRKLTMDEVARAQRQAASEAAETRRLARGGRRRRGKS